MGFSGARKKPREKQGPLLPGRLARELGTTPDAGGIKAQKRGTSMFFVSQRKQARKASRKARRQRPGDSQWRGNAVTKQQQPRRLPVNTHETTRSAKRQRLAPVPLDCPEPTVKIGAPSGGKQRRKAVLRTRFAELLSDGIAATGATGHDAEAALQRELSKKLGVRKGKTVKAKEAKDVKDVFIRDLQMPETDDEAELDGSSSGSHGNEFTSVKDSDSEDADPAASLSDSLEESPEAFLPEEGPTDSLSDAAEAFSSASDDVEDSLDGRAEQHKSVVYKRRRSGADLDQPSQKAGSTYVLPAKRFAAIDSSEEETQRRRRVTGLVNRLSDPNLAQITLEVLRLLDTDARRAVSDLLAELLLQAAAEGPRATDRFAAVTAAFVSSLSARAGAPEVAANFVAALAARLEAVTEAAVSSACSNLGLVFAQLHVCGLLPASCCYSLLAALTRSFREQDVVLMQLLLRSCGFKLRADDPAAMKEFVVGVHSRAAEAQGTMSERTEVMLELVLDIKNNRKRKGGAEVAALESLLCQGSLRFLRESRVGEIQLRGLTWEKLLQPEKKGMWWLPSAEEVNRLGAADKALVTDREWGSELLQLAAKHRMNTDVRRAVFCIIMGSEDYADASERLLRLSLKGEASREIVRVAFECCLQEASWNPYYGVLLHSILAASKQHAKTAQFCLWDQLKLLSSQSRRRVHNVASLAAQLIASKALPLSVLRVAKLEELSGQEEAFWQTVMSQLLLKTGEKDLHTLLKPASQPQLQSFASRLRSYLADTFVASADRPSDAKALSVRSQLAQKYLAAMRRTV